MKALTFIEYYKERMRNKRLGKFNDTIDTCDNYFDFVSQTFSPKMITEIFEGVRAMTNHSTNYLVENLGGARFVYFMFFQDGIIYKKTFVDSNSITYEVDTPIRTLNDFISDCQRAGIELTLKSEIAKRFF